MFAKKKSCISFKYTPSSAVLNMGYNCNDILMSLPTKAVIWDVSEMLLLIDFFLFRDCEFLLFKKNYLFLALLHVCCCLGFSLASYCLVAVCRFLIVVVSLSLSFCVCVCVCVCVVASLAAKEWTVDCVGFSACGSWALEHWFNSGTQA